jgi:hypothetical protein
MAQQVGVGNKRDQEVIEDRFASPGVDGDIGLKQHHTADPL